MDSGGVMKLDESLSAGATALGLALETDRLCLLLDYVDLLQKWNRVYNLTAIRAPREMVTHHLLDSLAVLPYVEGSRLLDVGSGAGLPGLVLAVARDDLHCTLLDSRGKKTRFLTQAVIELKLANVEVVHSRVEEYRPGALFDCIISRAFSDLSAFVEVAAPMLGPRGRLLAMKGAKPGEKTKALASGLVARTQRLVIPGVEAERHLVIIEASERAGR
ncbi:MAG: 16S rRNA (guanine(527)-N(7))-methyltransferase RsmG [Chromatiales bacterium]